MNWKDKYNMFWSKKDGIYDNLMSSITQLTLIVDHQEKDIELFKEILAIEKNVGLN